MKESICSQRGSVNSFLLTALKNGDKYAYEIGKAVKEISGGKFILKEASLYSGLKRLEAQGFLTSYSTELENGLTRRYYCLTDAGKEKLKSINFSWDSEQKDSILKAFNDPNSTSTLNNGINSTLSNSTNAESFTQNVSNSNSLESDINCITISDEDENLTKHNIHENQQDLFAILNNKNNENTINISKIYEETQHNDTIKQNEQTINSVNENEFNNLKSNLKTENFSFLDKINTSQAKTFTTNSLQSQIQQNNNDISIKFENKVNLNQPTKEANYNNLESVDKNIDKENSDISNENLLDLTNKVDSITTDSLEKNKSSIDISSIFGDLCIKNNNLDSLPTETEDNSQTDTTNNKIKLNNADIINNYDNINCTLEIPAKKLENEETLTTENDNSDILYSTKPVNEIFDKEDKNLNELFEIKTSSYKPSITLNNSVQYANQKIDYEKPSFESKFANLSSSVYEIREYKPIETKQVKSSFINLNKIKMISGFSIFILQLLITTFVYLFMENTPLKLLNTYEIISYIGSITVVLLVAVIQFIAYLKNKFKMVEKLDFKTNIFFKILLCMCTLSTLFIVCKFFEINLMSHISSLVIVPLSIFVSLLIEELIKFFLFKNFKN